jgi:hypothetical protein
VTLCGLLIVYCAKIPSVNLRKTRVKTKSI